MWLPRQRRRGSRFQRQGKPDAVSTSLFPYGGRLAPGQGPGRPAPFTQRAMRHHRNADETAVGQRPIAAGQLKIREGQDAGGWGPMNLSMVAAHRGHAIPILRSSRLLSFFVCDASPLRSPHRPDDPAVVSSSASRGASSSSSNGGSSSSSSSDALCRWSAFPVASETSIVSQRRICHLRAFRTRRPRPPSPFSRLLFCFFVFFLTALVSGRPSAALPRWESPPSSLSPAETPLPSARFHALAAYQMPRFRVSALRPHNGRPSSRRRPRSACHQVGRPPTHRNPRSPQRHGRAQKENFPLSTAAVSRAGRATSSTPPTRRPKRKEAHPANAAAGPESVCSSSRWHRRPHFPLILNQPAWIPHRSSLSSPAQPAPSIDRSEIAA